MRSQRRGASIGEAIMAIQKFLRISPSFVISGKYTPPIELTISIQYPVSSIQYPVSSIQYQLNHMKRTSNFQVIIAAAFICLMAVACKSTQDASKKSSNNTRNVQNKSMVSNDVPAQDLAELIRRQPSVTVTGSGENISIRIRGNRSFTATNEPLFILDGRRVGHIYSVVAHMVNPADVARINVIRDPATLSSYGSQGANGVIEIKLKK